MKMSKMATPSKDTISSRQSFGRARSVPIKVNASSSGSSMKNNVIKRDSGLSATGNGSPEGIIQMGGTNAKMQPPIDLRRSKSETNVQGQGPNTFIVNRKWSKDLGASPKPFSEKEVTRHDLYKEALYTSAHFLGKATKKFPCSKNQLCIYTHETFSVSQKEQKAVIEHTKKDLFPNVGIYIKVLKAEGLHRPQHHQGNGNINPNAYCVIAIQEKEMIGASHPWQKSTQGAKNPLKKITKIIKGNSKSKFKDQNQQPLQLYADVPPGQRTTVQIGEKNPSWHQIFQCVSVHPTSDVVVVEVWDQINVEKSSSTTDDTSNSRKIQENKSKNSVKKKDVLLGKVFVYVNDISSEGSEIFVNLQNNLIPNPTTTPTTNNSNDGKIRLRLWLVHLYRHGKHHLDLVNRELMMECLWDWILSFEKKRKGQEWNGQIPIEATCLLHQYALQTGMSEETHCEIRWKAYGKHKLDINTVESPLKELATVCKRRVSASLAHKSLSKVDASQMELEISVMTLMDETIYPIIRNHLNEPEDRVNKALKSYKGLVDMFSNFEKSISLPVVQSLFEKALRLCILEWYESKFSQIVQISDSMDRCQFLKLYVEMMNEVNKLLSLGMTKWHLQFWMLANYNSYNPIVFDELQKMVNHDIEAACWTILRPYDSHERLRVILKERNDKEQCIAKALFSLYIGVQSFVRFQNDIFDGTANGHHKPNYTSLKNYHRWFRPILVLWLGFAVIQGSEMITKSVNIDNVAKEDTQKSARKSSSISSSAIDTASVIHQMIQFWQKLMWPDVSEKYVIIHFLIEIICYYTVLYAKRKHEKLLIEGFFDTVDRFDISERLCTALNNIEYVKDALESIPEDVKYDLLIQELEEACGITLQTKEYRLRLKRTFHMASHKIDRIFDNILDGVGNRIRPEISSFVLESLEVVYALYHSDHQQIIQAADPLLSYIDENIVTLSESLKKLNFARMLLLFWNLTCSELLDNSQKIPLRNAEEERKFFNRILQMIKVIKDYFDNGDAGLDHDELDSEEFRELYNSMILHTINTRDLIGHYYGMRAVGQFSSNTLETAPYGTLKVKMVYIQGKLIVNVISASDLIPSDESFSITDLWKKKPPNSDPFVEMELQPARLFTNSKLRRTSVVMKNLNPVFNEKFEWDVTLPEVSYENAVFVFTVKDYDYLSENDFLGEAVVPFGVIPGMPPNALQSEPQPMNLHLRVMKPCAELTVLKSRKWDTDAQKFYHDQNIRRIM